MKDKSTLTEMIDDIERDMNKAFGLLRIRMFIYGTINGLFVYHFASMLLK